MRTTLTLDPDVAQNLKKKIENENLSLKEAVNQALRAGLKLSQTQEEVSFKVEPHACGFRAGIDQDKLNQLVDELEVEEAARKLER
jgi:hypothetical protein